MTSPFTPVGTAAAPKPGRGTRAMVAGAVVSAIGAILFQLLGTRGLGEVEFAPIALLWTMQFLGFTVLYTPVEQLIIRRLTLSGGRRAALRSIAGPGAIVIVGGAALAAGWVAANRASSFQGRSEFVVIAFVLFLALGAYAVARGFLAGTRRFYDYGVAVGAEAVGRIALLVVVLVAAATAVSVGWVLAAAPLAALVVRPFRHPVAPVADELPDDTSAGGFLGGMLVATSASQTVLAAGPLVVDALGATEAAVTTFFVTFTLFRGPLTASYNLLARVLPWFTSAAALGADDRVGRAATLTGIGTVVAAVAAAGAGAALGPPIVEILFDVRPEAGLAALAAGGVVLGAVALFMGQVLVGRGATATLAVVWVVALVIAVAVLFVVDASPSMRTAWGFAAGETAALAGTAGAVAWPHRAGR